MIRRFGVAALLPLTGVVVAVACSGKEEAGAVAIAAADAAADAGAGADADADAGAATDANADADAAADAGEDAAAGAACLSADPVAEGDLPWAPPTAPQIGKCSQNGLTLIEQYLQQASPTNEQLEAYIKTQSAACHDCIYTDALASTWGPAPLSGGKLVTINIGACWALVSGKVACGKAVQNEFDCEFVACSACPDSVAFRSCRTLSHAGTCAPFTLAKQIGCAGAPSNIATTCGKFLDSVRVQCVSGP